MQATVRWQVDRPDRAIVHEKIVAVPKSEQSDIGFFAVHFYRDGSVKVLVTTKTDKHPAYPYQRSPSRVNATILVGAVIFLHNNDFPLCWSMTC